MNDELSKIKYFLYARKSSESEDRQVQSIGDQKDWAKNELLRRSTSLVNTYQESKSAKMPHARPEFNRMVQDIREGKANGIICWKLNRLFRNPVDSGEIQWMLQQGIIKSIITSEREYLPQDNALIFSFESGSANQYLLDLSKDVKRGFRSKLAKGERPGPVPMGYLNNLIDHTIIKDPERFDYCRKMWDMLLTGRYTPPMIADIVSDEWGLRTRKTRKQGGNRITASLLYKMFGNIFYAGIIDHKGEKHSGSHEAMVTLDEFDKAQQILGRRNAKPVRSTHKFAFSDSIRCGECGFSIVGEKKKGKYSFYHCSKRRKDYKCQQKHWIREEELARQIEEEVNKYSILPEFKEWAFEVIRGRHENEVKDRERIYETRHKTYTETQRELDNLINMRARDLINDDQFLERKRILEIELKRSKQNLRDTEQRAHDWVQVMERAINFAADARQSFIHGDTEKKREILLTLGSNQTLKDGKFSIEADKTLVAITKDYSVLEKRYKRLELDKKPLNATKNRVYHSIRSSWLGMRANGTTLLRSGPSRGRSWQVWKSSIFRVNAGFRISPICSRRFISI